jgi:hypothetical protein
MSQLAQAVEAPVVKDAPGGILASALPAPQGWAQGLSIPFYGCGEPLLQDRCVTANDTVHRSGGAALFIPFGISQGASCSTLSLLDQKKHAAGRLDATTEWAVGRQLATDGLGLGTPSLDDGTDLGTVAGGDFTTALSVLEQAAADAGFGSQWWVHAPVRAASYLANAYLVDEGLTASGAPVVISAGYPVQDASTVRLWATGPVWASVDDPFILNNPDWSVNEDTAFANRQAIVAFDPCINLFIDVTVPASPTP